MLKRNTFAILLMTAFVYTAAVTNAYAQTIETKEILAENVIPTTDDAVFTQPVAINIDWSDFMNATPAPTSLADIAPAAGGAGYIPEEDFSLSFVNDTAGKGDGTGKDKVRLEFSYKDKKNLSVRTKQGGLMLYRRVRFAPERPAAPAFTRSAAIEKPSFE